MLFQQFFGILKLLITLKMQVLKTFLKLLSVLRSRRRLSGNWRDGKMAVCSHALCTMGSPLRSNSSGTQEEDEEMPTFYQVHL